MRLKARAVVRLGQLVLLDHRPHRAVENQDAAGEKVANFLAAVGLHGLPRSFGSGTGGGRKSRAKRTARQNPGWFASAVVRCRAWRNSSGRSAPRQEGNSRESVAACQGEKDARSAAAIRLTTVSQFDQHETCASAHSAHPVYICLCRIENAASFLARFLHGILPSSRPATVGAAVYGHDRRLLELRLAESAGVDPTSAALVDSRRRAALGVFRYELDCLSSDAFVELKCLVRSADRSRVRLADGGVRLLTGLVTRPARLGADGGFGHYQLKIEPALAASHTAATAVRSATRACRKSSRRSSTNISWPAPCSRRASTTNSASTGATRSGRTACNTARATSHHRAPALRGRDRLPPHPRPRQQAPPCRRGRDEVPLIRSCCATRVTRRRQVTLPQSAFTAPMAPKARTRSTVGRACASSPPAGRLASYDYKTVDVYRGSREQRISHGAAGGGRTHAHARKLRSAGSVLRAQPGRDRALRHLRQQAASGEQDISRRRKRPRARSRHLVRAAGPSGARPGRSRGPAIPRHRPDFQGTQQPAAGGARTLRARQTRTVLLPKTAPRTANNSLPCVATFRSCRNTRRRGTRNPPPPPRRPQSSSALPTKRSSRTSTGASRCSSTGNAKRTTWPAARISTTVRRRGCASRCRARAPSGARNTFRAWARSARSRSSKATSTAARHRHRP